MAKPNHLDGAAHMTAQAFAAVVAATQGKRDALDAAAFAQVQDACDALARWRRDTTEASRRDAYGAACAAIALSLAPVPGAERESRVLIGLVAIAVRRCTKAECVEAIQSASKAERLAHAAFAMSHT